MTCFCPSFPLPHHARLSDPGADLPEFVDCGEPMGSSDAFIRATINRLGARIGHGLADAAAEIAVLAQDAPDRLRQEWDLFQEEVRAESSAVVVRACRAVQQQHEKEDMSSSQPLKNGGYSVLKLEFHDDL